MKEISAEEYKQISQDNQKKIIIFTAPWCSPCRMFKPVLDKVSKEMDVPYYAINTDEESDLAQGLNIRTVPTTFLYNPASPEPTVILGVKSESEIKSILA